jgi:hypothetical protein
MHPGIRRSTLLLAAAASTAGCSTEGGVVIQNETATELVGELDGRGYALSGYESIEMTVKIGTRALVFGPDSKDVVLTGESCTRTPFEQIVTISRGDPRRIVVQPDAVCAIFQNQGEFAVDRVFQRDHGDADWGENLVDEPLFTTESFRRRLAPGSYDFLMIDTCDDSTLLATGEDMVRGTVRWVTHVAGQDGCVDETP